MMKNGKENLDERTAVIPDYITPEHKEDVQEVKELLRQALWLLEHIC